MKKAIITQSNYIPWKGYFDAINCVDVFVIYDDMQYTKRDWRNRNLIKTPQGLKWLTIPVEVKGKYYQKINEVKISNKNWVINHLNIIKENYKKAAAYPDTIGWLENLYLNCNFELLSEVNEYFLNEICTYFDIKTEFIRLEQFEFKVGKTERLIEICKKINADNYFTGPAAKNYIDESLFNKNDIKLNYFNYSGYNEYNQLYGSFEHGVSIIDLLLNQGNNAHKYLKSIK